MEQELSTVCEEDLKGVEVNGKDISEIERGYVTNEDIRRVEGIGRPRQKWDRCVWSQCVYRT